VFKKDALSQAVEDEQLRLLSEASGLEPDSAEFALKIEQITKLDVVKTKKTHISKDALVSAGASVLGILLVLNFEKAGAIVSKSFSLVRKP
jgi:hypothetical protein